MKKSGNCGKNGADVTWTLENGVLTIRGKGAMQDYDNDNNLAPWFNQPSNIKTVNIENGITSIGDSAFEGCDSLESIEIPNSVTSIGDWAFSGCYNLKSIEIPSSVTSIGDGAFSECIYLRNIYYTGSQAQWEAITGIGKSGLISKRITIHYSNDSSDILE